ncbi:MAG TPA: tetratricopeptide repeat protein [Pirellulales bacterium]|nr:tetratricopeptide repeat protein [Pirellulales bacterium]
MPESRPIIDRASRLIRWLTAGMAVSLGGCSVASHAHNAQGVSFYQQGRYQEAVQNFERAIANDPKNADGYYNLAATYHKLGLVSHNENELKQAENLYNQCLDRDANHRDCYRGLAVLLAEEGRSDEAFRLLEGWSTNNPSSATPKVELARLSEEFGRYDVAKAHLEDALQTDPHDARALAALGRLRERSGNQGQALAVYQRSLWNNPSQPDVAARVSTLQSALNPPSFTNSPGATRMVNTNPAPAGRY